jgi:hypothetical protein
MEGSSDIVDTTFAVSEVSSRKVWKPVYPFTLEGDVNFEGQFSRLVGPQGPEEDQVLFQHKARLREPGIAACLARRSTGVTEIGTISALTPERNDRVTAFACEHGVNAAVFEEIDVASSPTIDPGLFQSSKWQQGILDSLRLGSDRAYGVERVVYSLLATAPGQSTHGAVGGVPLTATPGEAGNP